MFIGNGLTAQTWTQAASMPGGQERYNAVSFSIGGKGYVTTGQTTTTTLGSTWEYDPVADNWTQKADFPVGHRRVASGFAIGDKGYVLCGRDDSSDTGELHNDLWEFDPEANTWAQKANFPGGNRENLVAFSIDGYGYAGLGLNYARKLDFYRYDPSTDTWLTLPSIAYADHHYNTTVFTLDGKGYFATGSAYNFSTASNYTTSKVYMFDPATGIWTQKNDFPGGARQYGTAFTANGKAYFGMGNNGLYLTDLWQYDAANDTWFQIGDFTPGGRVYTSVFTLGSHAYVGNGRALSQTLATFYTLDTTLSVPGNSATPIEVVSTPEKIEISPVPVSDFAVSLFAMDGKQVFSAKFTGNSPCLIHHQLTPGVYLIRISGERTAINRKVAVP
jgi:N-acetylneuraminic acid mutarotase